MRKFTQAELDKIIENHQHWLKKDCDNSEKMKANFNNVDLSDADLRNANLSYVNFSKANLRHADLSDADLRGADLSNTNLSNAKLIDASFIGANLNDTDLHNTDLSNANLSCVHFIGANLKGANLRYADLSDANLSDANLSDANLRDADLRGANLSNTKGLLSSIDYLKQNFEFTKDGIIAYKTFNGSYTQNLNWKIEPEAIITENVNFNRTELCGCGINVAPLEWVKKHYNGDIWKVLIKWEWLCGVIVPYNTNGKIRCERVQLIEIIDRS